MDFCTKYLPFLTKAFFSCLNDIAFCLVDIDEDISIYNSCKEYFHISIAALIVLSIPFHLSIG